MYYILHKQTRAVVRESSTPFNVDEAVQPADPHIQLKRILNDSQPAFNPATQKLVREFVDDDTAFTRTFRYVVIALTQAEIGAYNLSQSDNAELVQIRAAYDDLKNGVGTATQRQVRCEKAIAWLLRQHVRNTI